ncbi:nitrate reductase molybdenum cofactor assembly chaperone [Phytohabitans sp. ZYX-F-186]|uniref:Nitrate reductase molybdenum cofactor assembly chaperone n=1 Tax=Phytohabitans maris TaxID=3071409 RepID=A0ABU0ZTP4_9ACTN|nr:nitrate reductase molybdenum cofactor assembly chaperone [Phytohabitans sp. ZYX-F-186]MDQ7910413.1 nitrate reductase molybdenum cofactor assembly chaperone [Phytohabitans sp. ZYX-F-186]
MNERAVAAKAASLLLRYPDPEVLAALPAVVAALDELPGRLATPLAAVAAHRAAADPIRLAAEYVETFDFRRRCALHLTYYTHGDTRARGPALAGFAAAYRAAGLAVTGGELPDYLPAVLDLAAAHGSGWDLLGGHRVGLDLLVSALERDRSVYAHAVRAVRLLLPPPTPADLAAAAGLARGGPPVERVGLQPYTPTGGRP